MMGSSDGPHSLVMYYRLSDRTLCTYGPPTTSSSFAATTSEHKTQTPAVSGSRVLTQRPLKAGETFLSAAQALLEQRRVGLPTHCPAPTSTSTSHSDSHKRAEAEGGLPDDLQFCGGLVGYLSYEMKAETQPIARTPFVMHRHTSPSPAAATSHHSASHKRSSSELAPAPSSSSSAAAAATASASPSKRLKSTAQPSAATASNSTHSSDSATHTSTHSSGSGSATPQPVPDACFVFADRTIVFDHEMHKAYALCVCLNPSASASAAAEVEADGASAKQWLTAVTEALQNLTPLPALAVAADGKQQSAGGASSAQTDKEEVSFHFRHDKEVTLVMTWFFFSFAELCCCVVCDSII